MPMASTISYQQLNVDRNPKKQIVQEAEERAHKPVNNSIGNSSEPTAELKQEMTVPSKDPLKAVDQTLNFLKAKDDTSRFVGLALLKTILDNEANFQNDAMVIEKCWTAIPAKFIDRLLNAGANKSMNKEDSLNMVDLAAAVLHAFIIRLPTGLHGSDKFIERIDRLIDALAWSSPEASVYILRVLVTLANTQEGSAALLRSKKWQQLVVLAAQQDLALDVIKYAFIASSSTTLEESDVQEKINPTLLSLVSIFGNSSKDILLSRVLNHILITVPVTFFSLAPTWLNPLAKIIIQSYTRSHKANSAKGKQAIVTLAASLLHLFPSQFPNLLFDRNSMQEEYKDSKPKAKPFLFVKLLLIDIKTSIPSLQEILNSPHYLDTSTRIAYTYDIISAFIGFLVQMLDQDENSPPISSEANGIRNSFPFPPSLLLEFRADISEALSLTIEHLRDRFDSSIAGAAGLDPAARSCPDGATNVPLSITWDSSSTVIDEDPLTLSELRTLAIWLREDENDALRRESAGIMDLLLTLYDTEGKKLDFKSPVLIALKGIIIVPEGIDTFLAAEGWSILVKDLQRTITNPSNDTAFLGVDIVRVLLAVAESDIASPSKEEWIKVIKFVTYGASAVSKAEDSVLDLRIAIAQLAVEVLTKAPKGVRRRHLGPAREVLRFSREALEAGVGGGAKEGLEEVILGLEELGIRE